MRTRPRAGRGIGTQRWPSQYQLPSGDRRGGWPGLPTAEAYRATYLQGPTWSAVTAEAGDRQLAPPLKYGERRALAHKLRAGLQVQSSVTICDQ